MEMKYGARRGGGLHWDDFNLVSWSCCVYFMKWVEILCLVYSEPLNIPPWKIWVEREKRINTHCLCSESRRGLDQQHSLLTLSQASVRWQTCRKSSDSLLKTLMCIYIYKFIIQKCQAICPQSHSQHLKELIAGHSTPTVRSMKVIPSCSGMGTSFPYTAMVGNEGHTFSVSSAQLCHWIPNAALWSA